MMFSSKQIQALDRATRDDYLRPLPQRKPSRAAPETVATVVRFLDAAPALFAPYRYTRPKACLYAHGLKDPPASGICGICGGARLW